ncbi:MAG TPA: PQQ-binding-like beta-propeller repeat protein, partial [Micromonosporaceae bacterium]|nr:PQQ-binding-like beta-propeller repeat protein [Micromonosporaceae bacterium]
ALLGVVAIFVIYGLLTGWNPLPGWAAWLRQQTATQLSDPRPPWTVRAGDQPHAAVVLDGAIVVTSDGSVEVRDPRNGDLAWRRRDAWAGVAGGDAQPVVIVGRTGNSGFDVYDAKSGVSLWKDDDHDGVWPYVNMVLVMHCDSTCHLIARDPVTGRPEWTAPFASAGAALRGFDRPTAALVPPASRYSGVLAAAPVAAPALIGLSVGGTVHVVSTADGHEVRHFTSDAGTRVVVAGGVVLVSTAVKQGQSCYSTIAARDARTGADLWQKPGYDPGTVSGAGCEQDHDPVGAGDTVLVIDPSGRDTLLNVSSGHVVYRAPAGEHVIATDGGAALVRSKDGKVLRVIELDSGHELYNRPVTASAQIGLAPGLVLVADPAGRNPHIVVYELVSGSAHLNLASSATVLGVGANTLVINIGRSFGPVTLSAPA